MTRKVKIVGAGSIGNHLANAARRMGWDVVITDIDGEALRRTRDEIYPSRYGAWDPAISLFEATSAPLGGFDAIFVGTPPDSHVQVSLASLDEEPTVLLVEKPLCPPTLNGLEMLDERSRSSAATILVGYNHVVSRAAEHVRQLLAAEAVGTIETIDVDFREHWGGIFKAHPWLTGPADSYLGSWERGGGAGGEHSHGLNLWQHFALAVGAGRVSEVSSVLSFERDGSSVYDRVCSMTLLSERGVIGRVVQDVVASPPRKAVTIQGSLGRITWICGYQGTNDAVLVEKPGEETDSKIIEKTRADDFIEELKTVGEVLGGEGSGESISFERGKNTALVLHAVHRSEQAGKRVTVNYDRGYVPEAVEEKDE